MTSYTFSLNGMGHHALAWRSTSFGWGSYGSMEDGGWRRGSVGGLRDKGSQGIHGQHNSMQGRSVLRVTPTPLFIDFLGLFRVLSPWLGL